MTGTDFDVGEKILAELKLIRVAMEKIAAIGKPLSVGAPRSADGSAVFPFGKSKGLPVFGATISTLEYFKSRCLETLADPTKERFYKSENSLLASIEDEIRRQGGVDAPSGDLPF